MLDLAKMILGYCNILQHVFHQVSQNDNKMVNKKHLTPSVCFDLQPLTKILRQIADLQQKLTFQAIWKVLIFSLEMTRLLKIEKWLEASALGCHPAKNGHVTH